MFKAKQQDLVAKIEQPDNLTMTMAWEINSLVDGNYPKVSDKKEKSGKDTEKKLRGSVDQVKELTLNMEDLEKRESDRKKKNIFFL